MGRHEAPPRATFENVVSEYVTQRARELVRQFDKWQAEPSDLATATMLDWHEWVGAAAEILRELTRDA